MNAVIRTDASHLIGTGHVMRCLTLAEHLRAGRAEVTFICREHPGNLCDYIQERGFDVVRLPAPKSGGQFEATDDYGQWLAVSCHQDACGTLPFLKHKPDWLIVDHYGLDREWESEVRERVGRLMVIDDLANREHICDVLLDQNASEDAKIRYRKFVPEDCQLLLGPSFAMLRPEFAAARDRKTKVADTDRVLIFLGGVDRHDVARLAVEALTSPDAPHVPVSLIAGQSNPSAGSLEEYCLTRPQVSFYHHVENIAELMSMADLAIGAGGTTTWERSCVGLPSLVIATAENQLGVARSVDRLGIGRYLGKAVEMTKHKIVDATLALMGDPELRHRMSRAARDLVDGQGAKRVSEMLLESVE